MKKSVKSFVRSTIIQLLVIAVIWGAALTLVNNSIISNEIALGQMNSSNMEYVAWAEYQRVVPIIRTVINIIGCFSVSGIVTKIIFCIKNYKEKN